MEMKDTKDELVLCTIRIAIRSSGTWRLGFKSIQKAADVQTELHNKMNGPSTVGSILDDFGNHLVYRSDEISTTLFSIIEADLKLQSEEEMAKMRAQVSLKSRVSADPMISALRAIETTDKLPS